MRAILAAGLLLLSAALHASVAQTEGAGGSVMGLVRAGRWVEAAAVAARLPDPVAARLVTFYRLLTPSAASIAEIDAFRMAHPDWPLQATLLRRRDEALLAEPDDTVAVAACLRELPRAARSLLRCADGERRQGLSAPAAAAAQAAWVAASPDRRWEAGFLRDWAAAIGPAQQWARFDRLAWSDTAAAAAQAPRVDNADQKRAAARLALRRGDPLAADLVAALPAEQQSSPAMVLEHARWLRRLGRTAEAAQFWLAAGTQAERAAAPRLRPAFWDERNLLARALLAQSDPTDAYAVAAGTAQTAPEPVADAAFLAGWIALRRLSDPARAARQFATVAAVSHAAITQGRAHYWLGRAAAAAGDGALAGREYRLAAAYPSTFYGQLAALAAGEDPARLAARIVATRDPGWTDAAATAFAADELVRASVWLVGWGEPGRAAAFLLRRSERAASAHAGLATDQVLAARLAAASMMPQTAVALARLGGRSGLVLLDVGWPVAARIGPASAVDPALALGVIRQESSFDPGVVSPAGARGLMQLLPATAAAQARQLGIAASLPALTEDPDYNVRLGSAYLAALLERFGAAVPLAAAAYNGGPSRVTQWLAANGDPRPPTGDLAAMVDWIEQIPFSETRNYVQRVIENTVIYQAKLGETAPPPMPWSRSPA